jgi:hypothetical protein
VPQSSKFLAAATDELLPDYTGRRKKSTTKKENPADPKIDGAFPSLDFKKR